MSPTSRYNPNRWAKGHKSSYNASRASAHTYADQEYMSTGSATTASTCNTSDDERLLARNGHRQGQQLLGMICSNSQAQDMPPPPPAGRTPLRTKLTSGAALFVPHGGQAAPFIPQSCPAAPAAPSWIPVAVQCGGNAAPSGKDCLRDIIQSSLGNELWNLAMADCQAVNGDLFTSVEITIPALTASMCHLATSNDIEVVAAAQQATQSMAMQSVIQSLQNMGPKMILLPSEDTSSQISVQYCAIDKDMLCWEYSHRGQCPRGSTCRWGHALIETFMISFLLQPLTQWCGPQVAPVPAANTQVEQLLHAGAREPASSSSLAALQLTDISQNSSSQQSCAVLEDPDETPWPDHTRDCNFGVPEPVKSKVVEEPQKAVKPSRRARPAGRSWADIQEDSDGDEPFLPQWASQ